MCVLVVFGTVVGLLRKREVREEAGNGLVHLWGNDLAARLSTSGQNAGLVVCRREWGEIA